MRKLLPFQRLHHNATKASTGIHALPFPG
jgi:hypothetical protein